MDDPVLADTGSRKEIPLTELQPLTAEPRSAQEQNTCRQYSPGQQAVPLQQGHDYLPEDDSLVLYKDPSVVISTQSSLLSVVSGRHQHGDTFYTALRKDYSFPSELDMPDAGELMGNASKLSSHHNPMQSPDRSAYFSAMGDEDAGDGEEDDTDDPAAFDNLHQDYSTAASLASHEPSNYNTQTAEGQTCYVDAPPPATEMVDVIHSLYNLQSTDASHQDSILGAESMSLMRTGELPAKALAAASLEAADAQETAPVVVDGLVQTKPDQDSATDVNAASSAIFATSLPDDEHEGVARASAETPSQHSKQGGDELLSHAQAMLMSSSVLSVVMAPEPVTADSISGKTDLHQAEGGADQMHHLQAASSAYLAEVDQLLEAHGHAQAELSQYIDRLTTQTDEDGHKLVELPPNYAVLVERQLQEVKQQYRALGGWEGPLRFSELPIAQLPTTHDDPRIADGLSAIQKLDHQLKEVSLKFAKEERKRLARRAAELDEALAKERQRRLHAGRLLRALAKMDDQGASDLLIGGKGASSFSYYKLQPREEQLLAAVLSRDEASLEADNPFDASTACLTDGELSLLTTTCADTISDVASTSGSLNLSAELTESDPAEAVDGAHDQNPGQGFTSAAQGAANGVLQVPWSSQRSWRASGGSSTGDSRLFCFLPARASSSSSNPRTLAEIDAQLQVLQGRAPGVSGLHSVSSFNKRQPHAKAGGQRQQDYIREQREARELMMREQELDAKLRALKTSALPVTLRPEQLRMLLQEASQSGISMCAAGV
eukprot:gene12141-12279_t